MARIVLERSYDPATGKAMFKRDSEKLEPCIKQRNIRWIRSVASTDYQRVICEFEAPDADTMRDALRMAGVAFDRVWTARILD